MSSIPLSVAHTAVLRRCPRTLRAALDLDGRHGPVLMHLVEEAAAVDADLGAAVRRWVEFGCPLDAPGQDQTRAPVDPRWSRAFRVVGRRSITPAAPPFAMLDDYAARKDAPVIREVSDALIILTARVEDTAFAGRLASAVARDVSRLGEVGHVLHQLALVQADLVEQHRSSNYVADDPVDDAQRQAALKAWRPALGQAYEAIKAEANVLALGLALLAAGRSVPYHAEPLLSGLALQVGREAVAPVERRAVALEQQRAERRRTNKEAREFAGQAKPSADDAVAVRPAPVAGAGVLVCPASSATGAGKGKEVTKGYEHVIGRPVPLTPVPNLVAARASLLGEFPQAGAAIDRLLGELVGKEHVRISPFLLVGPPGSGKSRFVRRVGDALGVGVYRVDAANDAGASFGGTERRWYSAEPCRPFMAVARHRIANPLMLVDEIDKSPTRSDYGRIWDSMLQVLEPENARRFPDPCLQTELDLSWVSVLCTANDVSRLPGPLLDRLRVVEFPEPGPEHMGALLPALMNELAAERGLDPRFLAPVDGVERQALRRRWRGGSVRRLRRALEAVLRVRERREAALPQ